MAFLNKGLEIRFRDERVQPIAEQVFKFNGGIVDFVRHLNASKEPLFKRVISYGDAGDGYDVDIAMQWNTGYYEGIHSFANNIATTEGGMHEEGFKKALTNVVNRYAKGKGLLKDKDTNLLGEDIREGLTAIVSVKLRNPQFEGQTKAKLGNTEMRSQVEKVTNERLGGLARGTSHRSPSRGRQGDPGRARPHGRPSGPRPHPAQVVARIVRDAGEARRLLLEGSGPVASCSSSRVTAPAAPRSAPAIPSSRRSCPSGERSSTSSAPASTVAQERGDPGAHHRGRYRDRRGVRPREAPLPQDRADDRRRRRRVPHPHVAAHVLLPPVPRARARRATCTSPSPRSSRADIGKERHYLKDDAALHAFEADHEGRRIEVSRFKGLGEMDWQELGATTMDVATRSLLPSRWRTRRSPTRSSRS